MLLVLCGKLGIGLESEKLRIDGWKEIFRCYIFFQTHSFLIFSKSHIIKNMVSSSCPKQFLLGLVTFSATFILFATGVQEEVDWTVPDVSDCDGNVNHTSVSQLQECEVGDTEVPPSIIGDDMSNIGRSDVLELILAEDMDILDPFLQRSVRELKRRGAHRCWHKHSNFLEHLTSVHHTLSLWMRPEVGEEVSNLYARVGLMHSAYSNSYVNLALFDPLNSTERNVVSSLIGEEAESIVYLFCIIDRQKIVVDTLLKQGFIPEEGLNVPHLRDDSITLHLPAKILHLLIIFTMADISDQYFGFQDELFGFNENGNSMLLPDDDVTKHNPTVLWPGVSKPGLWVSYVSSLGAVAKNCTGEWCVIPPVLNVCESVVSLETEIKVRDIYWDVTTKEGQDDSDRISMLKQCIELNPFVFEPYILLAQTFLHTGQFDEAANAAQKALNLQEEWGFPWDKRLGFSAWRAWTQVLYQRASAKEEWPTNSWDINNLGLVY